jgi:hypothetical protein
MNCTNFPENGFKLYITPLKLGFKIFTADDRHSNHEIQKASSFIICKQAGQIHSRLLFARIQPEPKS